MIDFSVLDPLENIFIQFLREQLIFAPILLLAAEEAGIPLPIPGDIIIMYVGYQVARGAISSVAAFVILVCAISFGASILFFLSSKYGQKLVLQFGKHIHLNERKLAIVEEKFKKHGPWFIIFGRHIPGFRIPLTIFAGMSTITYKTFITSTFISIVFWVGAFLWIGMHIGPRVTQLLHVRHGVVFFFITPLLLLLGYAFLRTQDRRQI